MSLTYETDGPPISVGNRSVGNFREIRRLDYTAKNHWIDTVIEAPTVDLGRYGTGSTVGSYESINDNTEVSYDSLTDTRDEGIRDGSGTRVPNAAFAFASVPPAMLDESPSYTKSEVTSSVTVCKDGACEDNVSAVRYRMPDRPTFDLVMYKTDAWFIPLRYGTVLEVKRIEIHDE